jgi:transcriptional regulator with XRE-family HTH domain
MRHKSKRNAPPEWVEQITALRERLGINQAELARRMECSAMTISRWERGLLQPSAEHFIELGNLGNKTESWFFWEMAGIQPAKMIQALSSSRAKKQTENFLAADVARTQKNGHSIALPLLKTVAGAHGTPGDRRSSLRSVPVSEMVAVPASWCPNPSFTSLVRIAGASMQPAIRDRDIVAVDSYQSERRTLYGNIVVVTSERHGLSVSRLHRYDSIDVLEAEDRAPEPIIFKKSGGLRIVGRVLWSISGIP